jgi:Protein of unknown function (DUF3828)
MAMRLKIGTPLLTTLALLLIAATPAPITRADNAAIRAAIKVIYAPYLDPAKEISAFEAPVFSARTTALIKQWRNRRSSDEVSPLSQGDWFCQCQDWDSPGFRVTAIKIQPQAKGKVIANVSYDLGWDEVRNLKFVMIRERGKWQIDDLISSGGYPSLTNGLRQEIAEAGKAQ